MTKPTRTDALSPQIHLLEALILGPSEAIEAQEALGGEEMYHSDVLPVDTFNTDDEFLALGFTFGDPDPTDPIFRPAILPAGWSRAKSDHSMWTYLVDERGIRRVSIFYKAAFYDRSTHMRVDNVGGGVATGLMYATDPSYQAVDIDAAWDKFRVDQLTADETLAAIDTVLHRLDQIVEYPDIWDKTGTIIPILNEILERLSGK